jgi:hypothetical protein
VEGLTIDNRQEFAKIRERGGELSREATKISPELNLDPAEKVGEDDVVPRVTKVERALDGRPNGETKVAVGGGKGVVGGEDDIQHQAGMLELAAGVVDGGGKGDVGGGEQGLF